LSIGVDILATFSQSWTIFFQTSGQIIFTFSDDEEKMFSPRSASLQQLQVYKYIAPGVPLPCVGICHLQV
jgi:hypothetical protein